MNKNQRVKLYLFLSLLVISIVFAVMFPRLTLPFGFSYIVYLMSRPFMLRLTTGTHKQRLLYSFAMFVGVVFLIMPFVITVYDFEANLGTLTDQLPELQRALSENFLLIKTKLLSKFGIELKMHPETFISGKLEVFGLSVVNQFPDYLSSLFEWLILVPLFLYFFFMESRGLSKKLLEAIPNPIFEKSYVLFSQFNTKFGEYIIAKFIEAAILGTLITVGLLAVEFPYAIMLGFFAGIMSILPYIGPIIGFLPALGVALISKDPSVSLFAMCFVYVIANLIDMILVFPLLVSKVVNLHPIIVFVSIIIGSQLGGIIGMIIIIPFIAFFKLLFHEIYKDLSVSI